MTNDVISVPCWKGCKDVEFTVIYKPKTRYRFICPKCKSVTYVVITENSDILTFTEKDKCEDCEGTGLCGECNGTGWGGRCSFCYGTGRCKHCGGIGFKM